MVPYVLSRAAAAACWGWGSYLLLTGFWLLGCLAWAGALAFALGVDEPAEWSRDEEEDY